MKLFNFKKNEKKYSDFSIQKDRKEEEEFVNDKKKKRIGLKSSLIEFAALKRNLKVERLNSRVLLIELPNKKSLAFHNMNGIDSSKIGMSLCNSKYDAMKIFKNNGLTVTEVGKFRADAYEKALDYAEKIGFPVVIKPTYLSRSRGITTNIMDSEDFRKAWNTAFAAYSRRRSTSSVLVEKHVQGEDYRFFVAGDRVISATHRKRANVVGDGSSDILKLVQEKNKKRQENPYLYKYLLSENMADLNGLEEQELNFDSVPAKGEEIKLYSTSNPAAGRDSVDVTDIIHPGYRTVAVNALKAIPGMAYAGVDIIAQDITAEPTKNNHVIGEIESSPAPLTHFPIEGIERDMAGAIVEYYIEKYNN